MKKDADALHCSRICEGKRYSYSVREDGVVFKTSRIRFIENRAAVYLKQGKATVKINQKEYTLKNLVAEHFIESWHPGAYVEIINGDPFNCAAVNLRLYTQSEHGRRTGYRSRSQKVIADGVEYRSIRECAKALHCSYQTLLDYMGGNVKHSVIQGVNIIKEESQWPEQAKQKSQTLSSYSAGSISSVTVHATGTEI